MDSLGGILTKGLLGNPILANFQLFLGITLEDVTQPPTPTPTPTPTETPKVGDYIGGRSRASGYEEQQKRSVKITIRFKSKEYSSVYNISDRILRVAINTINYLNVVKDKISTTVKIKKKPPTVKVKLRDD